MRIKNTETQKWTHIIDADYHEADIEKKFIEDAVKSAANRLIEREYGSDYFGDLLNKIGETHHFEICRAVGDMTEHDNEFVDFELQNF